LLGHLGLLHALIVAVMQVIVAAPKSVRARDHGTEAAM
jgi:hypothetical protein